MQPQALKPLTFIAGAFLLAAAALGVQQAHAHALAKVADAQRERAEPRAARTERDRPPSRPVTIAKEIFAPRAERPASVPATAANLFRLEPSESWIPSALPSKRATRPSVGGFFGGFTE